MLDSDGHSGERRSAPAASPDTDVTGIPIRVRVCAIEDIGIGQMRQADLPGLPTLVIFRVAEREFYCTDDLCTHGNASLSTEGELAGCIVECGWHGGKFDVRSGEACAPPCVEALVTYPVILQDDSVYVET